MKSGNRLLRIRSGERTLPGYLTLACQYAMASDLRMIMVMRVALVAAGSRGDVEPLLALGAGLRQRGHEVRLAAPAEFEPLVKKARLEYRYLPGGPATMRQVSTTPGLAREIARSYDKNLDELLKETAAACRGRDVVVDTAMSHTDAITGSGVL